MKDSLEGSSLQNSFVRIEGFAKGVGQALVILSSSVYIYVLAYLDLLKIPTSPSFSEAVSFFVRSFFNSSHEIREYSGIYLFITLLFLVGTIFLLKINFYSKYLRPTAIIIIIIIIVLWCLFVWSNFLALLFILIPPFVTMFLASQMLEESTLKEENFSKLIRSILLFLTIVLGWTLPYIAATNFAIKYTKNNFPLAYNSDKPDAEYRRLLWEGETLRYWFKCDEFESYIVGENIDGEITYKRLLNPSQFAILCQK